MGSETIFQLQILKHSPWSRSFCNSPFSSKERQLQRQTLTYWKGRRASKMFKSFLEQRLNFIFTHLEEYQTSLRPFQQEAASECKISDNLTIERREDYWTVSDLQSALFGSSDSSILEQRLNFIFTHSEEYQMSLRPFLQEAASTKKWQYNN